MIGFFVLAPMFQASWSSTETANNISAHETLFRLGIAGELIGYAGFIFVALALYDLLKRLTSAKPRSWCCLLWFRSPIAFVNELNSVAALVLVRGADFLSTFDKTQRQASATLFLNLHFHGFVVAEISSGLWLFALGLLVYRSRFLPRFLGVWLVLGGVVWVMLSLRSMLFRQYYDKVYIYTQPGVLGEVAFMLWLLVKGARPPALDATALSSASA